MSQAAFDALEQQLDQVLDCTYAPSLTRLLQAVSACTRDDVELWAFHHTDAHDALAELLVASLDYDQAALSLLQSFAQQHDIRDALLRHEPKLLESLLRPALVNQKSFEQYTGTICAFLEHKLPEAFLPPAQLGILMGMLNEAVSNLDETIYLGYMEAVLLHNAEACFGSLSTNQQYAWQSTLASYLSHASNDLVMLALSCLASLAKHVGQQSSPQAAQKNAHSTLSLFQGDKGLKVVRLVVGSVSAALSKEEVAFQPRQVQLATNAISAVSESVLSSWLGRKEGQSLCRKLVEKIDLQLCEEAVQAGAAFLSAMQGVDKILGLDTLAIRICERAMDHLDANNVSLPLTKALVNLACFVPSDNAVVDRILRQLLNAKEAHDKLHFASSRQLLEGLTRIHITSEQVVRQAERLSTWAAAVSPTNLSSEHDRRLCQVLLCPTLSESNNSLKAVLCKLLVLQKSDKETPKRLCRVSATVSIQEAPNTPASGHNSRHWRERLLRDLQADAVHQHSQLVGRIALVCRDLEQRVETHELPLRQLEAALQAARQEAETATAQLVDAQEALSRRAGNAHVTTLKINSMQTELDALRAELKQSTSKVRQVQVSEQQALQQLDQQRRQATEQQRRFEEQKASLHSQCEALTVERQKMSESLSAMTRTNEDLQSHARQQRSVHAELEASINQAKQRVIELELASQSLTERFQAKTTALQSAEATIVQLTEKSSAESINHGKIRQHLEEQLSKTTSQGQLVDQALHQAKDALSKTQGQLEKTQAALEKMTDDRNARINQVEQVASTADEKIGLLSEQHAMAVQNLHDELKSRKERYDRALDTSQREHQKLRASLSNLRSKYEAQLSEYQEAQELSRRLMAVMGGAGALGLGKPALTQMSELPEDTPVRQPALQRSDLLQRTEQNHSLAKTIVRQSPLRQAHSSDREPGNVRPTIIGGKAQSKQFEGVRSLPEESVLRRTSSASSNLSKRKESHQAMEQASKRRELTTIYQDPEPELGQLGPGTLEAFLQDASMDFDDSDATRDNTVCMPAALEADKENCKGFQSGKKALRRGDSSILEELSGLGI